MRQNGHYQTRTACPLNQSVCILAQHTLIRSSVSRAVAHAAAAAVPIPLAGADCMRGWRCVITAFGGGSGGKGAEELRSRRKLRRFPAGFDGFDESDDSCDPDNSCDSDDSCDPEGSGGKRDVPSPGRGRFVSCSSRKLSSISESLP